MALLYAAVFFLAGIFPALISKADRALLFGAVVQWLPGTISIFVALLVAAVVTSSRLSPRAVAAIAIVFEIASSYGIAAAELLRPPGLDFRNATWIGLSWVAVWTLLFTIVVPSSPRRSVLAALAASSSVPVMAAVSTAAYPPPLLPNTRQFFFIFVFPYLLVVVMAYVGARVLFALGNEVRKARELGSYILLERLGQGGMGEVWRARHRLLARPAAIKLIRPLAAPSIIGSEAASRFEREAQAIASLRSPHTVDLFDFGIADDGTFYYVMELLEGLDVERIVNQFGPMPAGRVIHLIRQVCHSLSEAESISLVHRRHQAGQHRTELPIPTELDAIVLACLAKDPSDRPQTARELARRLEAVPVRAEWTPELARAWWETNQPRSEPEMGADDLGRRDHSRASGPAAARGVSGRRPGDGPLA